MCLSTKFIPLLFLSSKQEVSRWWVVAGSTYMTTLGGSAVDQIIVHGDYNSVPNDYDLAMMRVTEPLALGGRTVCSSIHSFTHKHTTNITDFRSDL